jgi:Tfp pilus assembly protein PilF
MLGQCAFGGQRRISKGQATPAFSVTDSKGAEFEYKPDSEKSLLLAFVSAGQEKSAKAMGDLRRIVSKLSDNSEDFDAVAAVIYPRSGVGGGEKKEVKRIVSENPYVDAVDDGLVVCDDPDYVLWGKFGVIVTPTVIIADDEGKVLWVEAGYGYDFAPVVETRLRQALGLAVESEATAASTVRTVVNATVDARVKRHLKMAKLLREHGREKSAIREIEKARAIDPNSVEVTLELGEIYCKKGDGAAAVKAIGKVRGANRIERSKVKLVMGWAKRLAGDLDGAEKELLEAVKENPRNGQALFELGRVYQGKCEFEKAADAYYRALSLVYGVK